MNSPLISIIIPTYNRAKFLEDTLVSVVNQTYQNIEIIVVDDGSSFNYAQEICQKYSKCTYHYKQNGGLSSARNFGILKAKGEYIAFVDDDDLWKNNKLEVQLNILENNSTIDCVHSSALVIDELGKLTGDTIGASEKKSHKRSGYVFWNALGCWVVKSPTPLIRKKVFKPNLMFDESIKVGEDVDFYQRMFYQHKVNYLSEPLAYYRSYHDTKRLSLQTEKYIGLEKKMLSNFKKMGINNPLILNKIARKLLVRAVTVWNNVYSNDPKKISKWDMYFRPIYCLNNYFNKK